jgi:hypothetical protein
MIQELRDQPTLLDTYFANALETLCFIVNSNPVFCEDLDLALKSQTFDDAIDISSTPRVPEQLPLGLVT